MQQCNSGKLTIRKKGGQEYYYIRLHIIDSEKEKGSKYSSQFIATGLTVSKRNYSKAMAMLNSEIENYSSSYWEKNTIANTQFHVYCLSWLERKKASIEITTYESYKYQILRINKYFTANPKAIGLITKEDINAFYQYLLTYENIVGSKKYHYSNRTIKDIVVMINMIFKDAVLLEHIPRNPAQGIKRPRRVEDIKKKGYISTDEIPIFLKAIEGHRLEIPLLVGLYYGLRREEILGLKWSAIHQDGRLYIEHTISQTKTINAKDRVKTSSSYRSYPIPGTLLSKIRSLEDIQKANRKYYGDTYKESDYLFTWEDGRVYTPNYITHAFKKIIRSTPELDNSLSLHSLRASCVSMLVHSGIDIKDIQEWVGHKDIQTTLNIYAKINEKEKEKVNQTMSKLLL